MTRATTANMARNGAEQHAALPVGAVDYRIVKKPQVIAARQNVIFVTYLPDGAVTAHTTAYLRALKSTGFSIVLIAAVPDLDDDIVGLDCDGLDGIVIRCNHGYDFSAWAHILRIWPDLWESTLLVFANDSVYGPLRPELLQAIVATVRATPADFVGLTDSCERDRWHIQSYFFALKPGALASPACRSFWDGVQSFAAKRAVIDVYEVVWAQTLKDAGLNGHVVFPSSEAILRAQRNPTLVAWKDLLREGFPFIKIELLRDRIPGTDCRGWERIVNDAGFDISLITRHLASLQKTNSRWLNSRRRRSPQPIRVDFIGPWNFASGLGVASRGYLSALWHSSLAVNLYPVRVPFHNHARISPSIEVRDFKGSADICIVHLNPDAWPGLLTRDMRRAIDSARYKIGLWVWEMEQVPPTWRAAFAAVDFVWAPSRYCRDAFRAFSPKPVRVLPHVVHPAPPLRADWRRARLGIPMHRRIILYTFDGASYLVRKNPFALVRAFAGSRLQASGWSLVLNTKNLLDRPGDGESLAKLAAQTSEVYLINQRLSTRDQIYLLAESEIYASPHASEGFGLTIAEAMAAGKLVVATDYGGSKDFLDASCGFPVKYTKVALQDDFGHYRRGGVWACVDEEDLERALHAAADAADDATCELGKLAARRIDERFSPRSVAARLEALCLEIAR
jgi:O-antigen biosynthesis protein